MKKLIIIAALALSLAGCASLPTVRVQNAVTLNTMLGVEGAYGSALTAARTYKALPLCLTGTRATPTNPCAQRSIVARLQAADRRAVAAIHQANSFIKNYPTVDASNVISAASAAVTSMQSVLSGAN